MDSLCGCDGSLEIIFGPMFSGKTTELQRRIRRYSLAKKACLVVKFLADTRYDAANAVTHDLQKCPAVPCEKLADVVDQVKRHQVIGIDEGQFFPDIAHFAPLWASEGKTVVVAALDGTFQRKPFGNVLELVPMAEKLTKLSAVCMVCCKKDACFTRRRTTETKVEIIGGQDKYLAVCRGCYQKEQIEPHK